MNETPLPLERTLRHLQGGSSEKSVEPSKACVFIETPRTPGMWILGGNKANVAKQ